MGERANGKLLKSNLGTSITCHCYWRYLQWFITPTELRAVGVRVSYFAISAFVYRNLNWKKTSRK